jgi:DNA processing protein
MNRLSGLGSNTIRTLISHCGSPERVFQLPLGKLKRIPGIGPKTASLLDKEKIDFDTAYQEIERANNSGARIISFYDKLYPTRLKHIPEPPVLLYWKGTLPNPNARYLGIVGTRDSSRYGLKVVDHFVAQWRKVENLVIISGLAYGIDYLAHKAALANNIPTIAVLANGLNTVYPPEHTNLAKTITEQGALVSESSMQTVAESYRFPARNRIVSGMCECVWVVEAKSSGGALITARQSLDYNREVFATPGDLFRPASEGCNELIRNNEAQILTNPEELITLMGWDTYDELSENKKFAKTIPDTFTEIQKNISTLLMEQNLTLEQLSFHLNTPINQIVSEILFLEMDGYVRQSPGSLVSWKN